MNKLELVESDGAMSSRHFIEFMRHAEDSKRWSRTVNGVAYDASHDNNEFGSQCKEGFFLGMELIESPRTE